MTHSGNNAGKSGKVWFIDNFVSHSHFVHDRPKSLCLSRSVLFRRRGSFSSVRNVVVSGSIMSEKYCDISSYGDLEDHTRLVKNYLKGVNRRCEKIEHEVVPSGPYRGKRYYYLVCCS